MARTWAWERLRKRLNRARHQAPKRRDGGLGWAASTMRPRDRWGDVPVDGDVIPFSRIPFGHAGADNNRRGSGVPASAMMIATSAVG